MDGPSIGLGRFGPSRETGFWQGCTHGCAAAACPVQVLQWTRDWKRAQALAWQVATAYAQLLQEVQSPLPGVLEWLQLMAKNNVPCALVSQ